MWVLDIAELFKTSLSGEAGLVQSVGITFIDFVLSVWADTKNESGERKLDFSITVDYAQVCH